MTDEDLKKFRGIVKEEINGFELQLEQKILNSEERIIKEVGNFVNNSILPQLDEKADKSDIDRLERKLDKVIDKNIEQDGRLDKIEATPTIAHELKSVKNTRS